jgi:hypothetical protein
MIHEASSQMDNKDHWTSYKIPSSAPDADHSQFPMRLCQHHWRTQYGKVDAADCIVAGKSVHCHGAAPNDAVRHFVSSRRLGR